VAIDQAAGERVQTDWERRRMLLPREMVDAPVRSLEQAVVDIVRTVWPTRAPSPS
jgi:hypothetical protein